MALGFTSYEVQNDLAVARAFERAAKQAENLKVPLTQISRDFMKSRKAIFQLSGPGGYPDLSSRYKEVKQRAIGNIYPILKLTGQLEGSITKESHPHNVLVIGPRSLEMGTTIPYGNYHQQEGSPGSKMPLRKFLFIGPEGGRFADSRLTGFPERALNTLNTFILRDLGLNIEQATGIKPKIKKGEPKI